MLMLLHPVVQVGGGFSVHASTVVGSAALGALYEWRARQAPTSAADGAHPGSPTVAQRAMFFGSLLVLLATTSMTESYLLEEGGFMLFVIAALVAALGEQLGFPMMVKPSRGGSALGCSKVSTPDELPAAMVGAYAYGPVAVVESFVEGTEVTVAVVDRGHGPAALPAVEIRPDSGVYDYTARYTAGTTRFLCPAELPSDVAGRCADVALRVHEELGLRDLSRTDLIIRGGEPVFLEVNVAPGMTETSAVPLASEAAGWSLGKMCADLVAVAAARGGRPAAVAAPA